MISLSNVLMTSRSLRTSSTSFQTPLDFLGILLTVLYSIAKYIKSLSFSTSRLAGGKNAENSNLKEKLKNGLRGLDIRIWHKNFLSSRQLLISQNKYLNKNYRNGENKNPGSTEPITKENKRSRWSDRMWQSNQPNRYTRTILFNNFVNYLNVAVGEAGMAECGIMRRPLKPLHSHECRGFETSACKSEVPSPSVNNFSFYLQATHNRFEYD